MYAENQWNEMAYLLPVPQVIERLAIVMLPPNCADVGESFRDVEELRARILCSLCSDLTGASRLLPSFSLRLDFLLGQWQLNDRWGNGFCRTFRRSRVRQFFHLSGSSIILRHDNKDAKMQQLDLAMPDRFGPRWLQVR